MLNFRGTNIIFVVLLLTLIAMDVFYDISWIAYLLLTAVYSLLLFYGSYFVQSQFYMKTVCKANTTEKKIAITFDDGPLEHYTPQILALLKAHQIKAGFFCIGKNAAANTALLKELHRQGHIIGSHSYTHSFWFDLLSAKKMEADLRQAHQLFKRELGLDLKWFRPPYGVTNPNLRKAVKQMGYIAIGWSVRSMDTVAKDEQQLLNKLTRALRPGAVFLFHDMAAITVKVLPAFINYVKEQGYEIAPPDKLLNLQAYAD